MLCEKKKSTFISVLHLFRLCASNTYKWPASEELAQGGMKCLQDLEILRRKALMLYKYLRCVHANLMVECAEFIYLFAFVNGRWAWFCGTYYCMLLQALAHTFCFLNPFVYLIAMQRCILRAAGLIYMDVSARNPSKVRRSRERGVQPKRTALVAVECSGEPVTVRAGISAQPKLS